MIVILTDEVLLTLGAQAKEGCLLVMSHLTYEVPVCPENTVVYSAANEGQNLWVFFSETAPLRRFSAPSIETLVLPCTFLRKSRMRIIVRIYHVVAPRVCALLHSFRVYSLLIHLVTKNGC